MWWKQNKWKVIAPAAILVVLLAAFWYGGDAPGLQGWSVHEEPPQVMESLAPVQSEAPEAPAGTAAPAETEAPAVTEAPEAAEAPAETEHPAETEAPAETTAPAETPAPTAAPQPTPTPAPTAAPAPSEAPGMEIDPNTGKDKYNTDPVPEGKPLPVEPENVTVSDVAHTCTLSISCATILDNLDWLDPEKVELVPEDGVILPPTEVTFYEGESVFNVLRRTCKQNRIHMEFVNTPMYNSAYIEGIHNLYEFDCGEMSGWMYSVNGWFPNYGVSRYQVKSGDVIEFLYTCNYGDDVGGRNVLG